MISAESVCEELHKRRGKHRYAPNTEDTYYTNFLSLIQLDDVSQRSSRLSQKAKSNSNYKTSKRNKLIRDVQECKISEQKREQANLTKRQYVNKTSVREKHNVKCNQELELQHAWDDIILGMHPKQNDSKQSREMNANNTYRYERSASYDPSYYVESSKHRSGSNFNSIRTKPIKRKSITDNAKATLCTNASSASVASSTGLTVMHDDEDSDTTCLKEYYHYEHHKHNSEKEELLEQEHVWEEKGKLNKKETDYSKELEYDYLQSKLNYHKMLNVFTTSFSSSTIPLWKEAYPSRIQVKANRHFAFAHYTERSNNAINRKHDMHPENNAKMEHSADVLRTPTSFSMKQSSRKEKLCKVSPTNNTVHNNDKPGEHKKEVAKIFVTVDKLCKTIVHDELDNRHKNLKEMERKQKALHTEEEEEEEEWNYQDNRSDCAKGIYNTYDVLPPLTSSTQYYNEEEEEEECNKENKLLTHPSSAIVRNDTYHAHNENINKIKRAYTTNTTHQHHTSERNPFDIAIADKASIPGPGTYDLMTRNNEREQMLHLQTLETTSSSSMLRLNKELMQRSESRSESYPSFTFAQSQRNHYHWNNPLSEHVIDKSADAYSPGPGWYDIHTSESAIKKNKETKAHTAKEVVWVDTERKEQEQEKAQSKFVNATTIMKNNNNSVTPSNKNRTREENHETSPGPGMYDIDTPFQKHVVTRAHSAPAWTIRNTRYDAQDNKKEQHHADRQVLKPENSNKYYRSNNSNFEMNNTRPNTQHEYQHLNLNISPGPLTYDPQKYSMGNVRFIFSTAERWGLMRGSGNELGNVSNREKEELSVSSPGAYDPYPAPEVAVPKVREATSCINNVEFNRVNKKKKELMQTKVSSIPGPATYYPSYDITLTRPPRTIFASNANPQFVTTTHTNNSKNDINVSKASKQFNSSNGEETRNVAVGPGMYDIDMSKLHHVRGGVINKTESLLLLPEHCPNTNRTRDDMTYIGPGAYNIDYNKSNNEGMKRSNSTSRNHGKKVEFVTNRHGSFAERNVRDVHLLGSGSYDTLYSEDDIRAHTPGVVMKFASVEKVKSMRVLTNDNDSISNKETSTLGPGAYDMSRTFTPTQLQNAQRKSKNNIQHNQHLKSKHQELHSHHELRSAYSHIDNTQNKTPREVAAEHFHSKTDKSIVDTPGPGTYYLDTAPIIHSVRITEQRKHKESNTIDDKNYKEWNEIKLNRVSDVQTVPATDECYYDDDTAEINREIVERAKSIEQVKANVTSSINNSANNQTRYNYDTLPTNLNQLQEKQHTSKQLRSTAIVSSIARQQVQTTENTKMQHQRQRNYNKEEETAVPGPGMYDSNNTQQYFGANTGTTFDKAARFAHTMHIPESPQRNNNKYINNTETLPGPGSYAMDKSDRDWLPFNSTSNKLSAYNYTTNQSNVNNLRVVNATTSKMHTSYEDYWNVRPDNNNTSIFNNNNDDNKREEMQHNIRIKKEEQKQQEESHEKFYSNEGRQDDKTVFLPVPEVLKAVHVSYNTSLDNVNDISMQNAIMCKNDRKWEYLHQHVFIRPLDDHESEGDIKNDINLDNYGSFNNFGHMELQTNMSNSQTLQSQTYSLPESNMKKKRVRFALDADTNENDDCNENQILTAASVRSVQMPTEPITKTQSRFTPFEESALNRVNAPLQMQQGNQAHLERVINMSPELQLPEDKVCQENLPLSNSQYYQYESTDAARKSLYYTPFKQELLHEEKKEPTTDAALSISSRDRVIYNTINEITNNKVLSNKPEYNTFEYLQSNAMPGTNTFSSQYLNTNTNSERVNYNTVSSSVTDDRQDFVDNNKHHARQLMIPLYTPQDDATTLAKLAQFGYPVV